jgi:hypothetical protein
MVSLERWSRNVKIKIYKLIAMMMEATRTSETLVNFYHTTRRYNPEDSHLRNHRRENLKSYLQNYNFTCGFVWV